MLKPLVDNVWLVDGPVVRMSAHGLHIPFPTRMTVVRLASGDLWLHSPVALSEALPRRRASGGYLERGTEELRRAFRWLG